VARKQKAVGNAEIAWPSAPSVPLTDLQDFSMLWYGREKIGKTSLAAQFEKALFLMTEPGGKALSIFKIDIINWAQFRAATERVIVDKDFRTIIVDTVDKAYEYCLDYACDKLAIDHPADEDYGKGWAAVADEFSDCMTRLLHCGKGIIFTSHAKEQTIKRRGGGESSRIVPTMAGGARRVIEPMIDIWAFMQYAEDGTSREMVIRGDDVIAAGHRLQKRFVGVERINLGKSAEIAYQNFMRAWAIGATEAPTTAAKPKMKFTRKA